MGQAPSKGAGDPGGESAVPSVSKQALRQVRAECKTTSRLSDVQIMQIMARFREIDTDPDGELDYEEFTACLGFDNELSKQLFRVFDLDGNGAIDMTEFVSGMSLLATNGGTPEDKAIFLFKLFDEDGSETIDQEELFRLSRALLAGVLDVSDDDLREVVATTFAAYDTDKSGEIDLEEFQNMLKTHRELLDMVSIPIV